MVKLAACVAAALALGSAVASAASVSTRAADLAGQGAAAGVLDASEAAMWPKPTDQDTVDKVYKLTETVTDVLKKHKCVFWLEGGAFLGAKRNSPPGMIGWDDDMDIGMWKSEAGGEACLNAAESDLKVHDIKLLKWFYGYKIYYGDGAAIPEDPAEPAGPKRPFTFPFIDVFLVECDKAKGTTWYPGTSWYGDCHFHCADVAQPVPCKFGPLDVFCADDSKNFYFNECYGSTWNDKFLVGKDHSTGVEGKKVYYPLTKRHRRPLWPSTDNGGVPHVGATNYPKYGASEDVPAAAPSAPSPAVAKGVIQKSVFGGAK